MVNHLGDAYCQQQFCAKLRTVTSTLNDNDIEPQRTYKDRKCPRTNGKFGFPRHKVRPFAKPDEPFLDKEPKIFSALIEYL